MYLSKSSTTPSQWPTNKHSLVSFINYASDLFQVEESQLYNPKTMEFTLIVHIPLVSNANLLELYEFLPLRIHFNFSANVSITLNIRQSNLLAIGHSKIFSNYLQHRFSFVPPPWRQIKHANSKLPKLQRRFSNWPKTPGLSTRQKQSTATRSAKQRT
jgi:hypothetical protein